MASGIYRGLYRSWIICCGDFDWGGEKHKIRGNAKIYGILGVIGLSIGWVGNNLKIEFISKIDRVISFGIPFAMILLAIVITQRHRTKHKRIGAKMASGLGMISYSLYLTHFIILRFCQKVFDGVVGHSGFSFIVTVVVCVFVGAISYKFIEKPIIGLFKKIKC